MTYLSLGLDGFLRPGEHRFYLVAEVDLEIVIMELGSSRENEHPVTSSEEFWIRRGSGVAAE